MRSDIENQYVGTASRPHSFLIFGHGHVGFSQRTNSQRIWPSGIEVLFGTRARETKGEKVCVASGWTKVRRFPGSKYQGFLKTFFTEATDMGKLEVYWKDERERS